MLFVNKCHICHTHRSNFLKNLYFVYNKYVNIFDIYGEN
ncbi:MAG: hypothetical protein RLZZ283_17 [Candidatus Parcubacteria bacterium]|jgi:hypothetical protein